MRIITHTTTTVVHCCTASCCSQVVVGCNFSHIAQVKLKSMVPGFMEVHLSGVSVIGCSNYPCTMATAWIARGVAATVRQQQALRTCSSTKVSVATLSTASFVRSSHAAAASSLCRLQQQHPQQHMLHQQPRQQQPQHQQQQCRGMALRRAYPTLGDRQVLKQLQRLGRNQDWKEVCVCIVSSQ
jgi:hypothetical protein